MMITDTTTGLPVVCDTCGAPAAFVLNYPVAARYCDAHSPISLVNMTVAATSISGHTICPTCGK